MFPLFATLVVLSPLFAALIVSWGPQLTARRRAERHAERQRIKDIDWIFAVMVDEVRSAPTTDIHHSMYRSDDESRLRSDPDASRSSGRAVHWHGLVDSVPRSVQAAAVRELSVPEPRHRVHHNKHQ